MAKFSKLICEIMKYIFNNKILVSVLILISLAGCGPGMRMEKLTKVCPGKASSQQSLYELEMYANEAEPLKANGRCAIRFYEEGKRQKKSFPVRIWYNPPSQLRLQGDVAFNPRGIVLGTNEDEYWLAMKPKEIGNSFFWGKWSEAGDSSGLKISPEKLLEAFGMIDIESTGQWSLENDGVYDVLVKTDAAENVLKKIYVYNCDYKVRKIEYFGKNSKLAGILEIGRYKQVSDSFAVPSIIKITSFNIDGTKDLFRINLRSVYPEKFSDKKIKAFFERPKELDRFKSVYRVVGDKLIEQRQER